MNKNKDIKKINTITRNQIIDNDHFNDVEDLKPNSKRCTASPTSLNNYYSSLAANLTGFTSNSESNVPSNANENRDIYSQTDNI